MIASAARISADDITRAVELYASGLTLREVGTRLFLSPAAVCYRLQLAGVERRHTRAPTRTSFPAPPADELYATCRLYEQGFSTVAIARVLGLTPQGVHHRLEIAGVPLRSRAQAARLRWRGRRRSPVFEAVETPPPDTFRTVIVTTSVRAAQTLIARHYPGPEAYVRVREVGRFTWAVDVALDKREGYVAYTFDERRAYQQQVRASLEPGDRELVDDELRCRGCGCSESIACPDGCGWVESDLCSACALEGVS